MRDPAGASAAPRDRTVLAWQRSALSVLVGAMVLLRLTLAHPDVSPAAGAVIVLAGLMSFLVMLESHRRAAQHPSVRSGRIALALAASVTLLLLVELWVVLSS